MPSNSIDRIFFRLSVSRKVEGLLVAAEGGNPKEDIRLVGEALRLIRTHDPVRYRMVLKEVARIWVRLLPGYPAAFTLGSRTCLIDQRFVLSKPVELIASAIIHEATHGRLHRRNVPYAEEIRHRVEGVCLRRELAFARKIPNGEVVISETDPKLGYPPEFFANAPMSERHFHGEIEAARAAGIPDWVTFAALRVRKFRTKLTAWSTRP